jgi:hypothetical protein
MGERLYFFWLRFRWLIVIVGFLVAIGAGALARVAGPVGDTDPVTTDAEEQAVDVDTITAESLLEDCSGLEEQAVYECRTALPQVPNVVLTGDRTSFLAGDAWRDLDGENLTAISGLAPADSQRISSGFTADLDNDGHPEHVLVTGEVGRRTLRILTGTTVQDLRDNTADRGFSSRDDISMVVPIDADRDGWLDIVAAYRNPRTSQSGADSSGGVRIHLNGGVAGPGMFSSDRVLSIGTRNEPGAGPRGRVLREASDMLVTDLDNDGYVDLVVVDRKAVLIVFWGSDTEATDIANLAGAYLGDVPTVVRVPMGVTGVDVADIDGDGKTDLLTSYDISIGSVTRSICVAETNNRPCVLYPEVSAEGGVAVLTQTKAREFTPNPVLSIKDISFLSDVAAHDIDADGREEIILAREPLTEDRIGNVLVYRAEIVDGNVTGYGATNVAGFDELGPVARISGIDLDANGTTDLVFSGRGRERIQTWTNPAAGVRHLRLVFEGAARFNAAGTSRDPIGVVVTIRDIDETVRTFVVDGELAQSGVTVPLPLTSGVWSGTENVSQVSVTFPTTGKTVDLKAVEANTTLVVTEPATK